MSTSKKLILLAIAAALLAISLKFFPYHCNCGPTRTNGANKTDETYLGINTKTAEVRLGPTVDIGTTSLAVDIADTPALREQGLSGRQELCADCGMLFIFPQPGRYGFWMKDMNFALDIVWITQDLTIAGVEKSLAPSTYPQSFHPPTPIKFVLELPAGTFDKEDFYVGEKVRTNL